MNIIKKLGWRYATKVFNANKKVSDKDFETILSATNLAPSSFGLEPWKFIVVENPEVRNKLKEKAWGQGQITDSSHLIVLATKKTMTVSDVDDFINRTAKVRGLNPADLAGYADMIKGSVTSQSPEHIFAWNSKQTYIALGFMLETAALMEIDVCPMEGFDKAGFDEVLKLTGTDYASVAVCAVGYRGDDKYASAKKVRKSLDEVVVRI